MDWALCPEYSGKTMRNPIKPTLGLLLLCTTIICISVVTDTELLFVVVSIGTLSVFLTALVLNRSRYLPWLLIFSLGMTISFISFRSITRGWLEPSLQKRDVWLQAQVIGLPVQQGELTRFDIKPLGSNTHEPEVTLATEDENGYRSWKSGIFTVNSHEPEMTLASEDENGYRSWKSGIFTVKEEKMPPRIRLTWRTAPEMVPGDVWEFTVRLRRPRGYASEGAFDYEAWIARQGVQATGYVKQGRLLQAERGVGQWLNRLRLKLRNWLQESASELTEGILIALLTGDKSGISQKQWLQLNTTGTTHLMVISGLHIGLMTALGYGLATFLGRCGLLPLRRIPLPVLAGCIGLLLAVFYAALAGFSIPVQRALVMTLVALSGPLFGIRPTSPCLWLVALSVVLLIDPLAFTNNGFWYSFLAVGGLLLGLGARKHHQSRVSLIWRPQWVVFLVLMPLLLINGQPVSPLSPLVNLVAIPLIGALVVPILLLAGSLYSLSPVIAHGILTVANQLVLLFLWLLDRVEPLASPVPGHASADGFALLFAMLAILLLISPASLKLRLFAPFLLLPWFFPVQTPLEEGVASITVMDIGQGLAVLIQTRQHLLVYDTGDRFTNDLAVADRVILPALAQRGIHQINRVMISHGDRDHSGGLDSLRKQFSDLDIWAGSAIQGYSGPFTQCEKGQHWEWDGVHFEVLAGGGYKQSNNCSCVLKITAGKEAVLLPGDISERVERQLLSDKAPVSANVLLAPHHGSKYSGSLKFLQEVEPEVVIFSTGYANRFGHPSEEALQRVKRIGAQVYNTAMDGSLSFLLGTGAPEFKTYRHMKNRYWWR